MQTRSAQSQHSRTPGNSSGARKQLSWLWLLAILLLGSGSILAASPGAGEASARLPGHVLPALANAVPLAPGQENAAAGGSSPLSLTFVLKRDDEAGFQKYLHDVYDLQSPTFRHFLTQAELSDRFGPSDADYVQVLTYLQTQGFQLTEGSANRMTLTVSGTRAHAEQAFGVRIGDYQTADRSFYANDSDPTLPAQLAVRVQSISGLSNLAVPQSATKQDLDNFCNAVGIAAGIGIPFTAGATIPFAFATAAGCFLANLFLLDFEALNATPGSGYTSPFGFSNLLSEIEPPRASGSSPAPFAAGGTGQTVGLLEFDNFHTSDVSGFLSLVTLVGASPGQIGNLSNVHVNGGTSPGAGQDEVLLDIDTVMSVAPGANVVVYDAPLSTSYQAQFNAMISGGVTIISNSWASCEDQVTLADVQGIDTILQSAAASGISVFNGAGDNGSTCLDGSPNTISVPADSPHATAVGGTSLTAGPGYSYGSETWWNGANATPSTGQGGFGISRFFARPSYQNGLTSSATRSVPDVAFNADPAQGFSICEADAGGCPTGLFYGGTSFATPFLAAATALLNQTEGHNLGALNPLIYPFANTTAFHDAASMGSDFAHIGLGSPNHDVLHALLRGQSIGIPDASSSTVSYSAVVLSGTQIPPVPQIPADGTSTGIVVARLLDANGNSVSGRTVTLSAGSGGAVITPASGVSTSANGTVAFSAKDLSAETVTFTARDTTDGVQIAQSASLIFGVPRAASAGINAFPTTVPADGTSTTTITVTLQDSLGRPTPGKEVTMSQGSGHSVVSGPSPSVTGSNGEIQFTASDQSNETVTYTAVDVADGNLPVPGSATVMFNNSTGTSCASGTPPVAASGFALTPFATGFFSENFSYGNINFGCAGVTNPTFTPGGGVYIVDFPSGNLYRFGSGGGAATSPLSNLAPTVSAPTLGLDGRLYVTHAATTGNFTTGDIVEIDPSTGATLRTVASNLTCPGYLAVDPLSGDLFFDDGCSGGGSDNPSLFRVIDPANTDPQHPTSVVVYATLPSAGAGNGIIAVSPDGTLYVVSGYYNHPSAPVVSVSATNMPQPPTVTTIPNLTSNYWINVGAAAADGTAKSLIILAGSNFITLESVDITTNPYTVTPLATDIGSGTIGPDGCLYSSGTDTVYKLAPITGPCEFAATNPAPAITLSPASVSPNPAQGSSQSFTASFHNLSVPVGTPVFFQIGGANAQLKLLNTNASGQATLNYSGVNAGGDVITASATVNSATLTSNPAQVTWNSGPHTTFLSLNNSPSGGDAGKPVTLAANLVDVSVNPAVAVAGATIQFSVDGRSCSGVTNAGGVASCSLTVPAVGAFTLSANYAGATNFLPATTSEVFSTLDRIFANGFDPLL